MSYNIEFVKDIITQIYRYLYRCIHILEWSVGLLTPEVAANEAILASQKHNMEKAHMAAKVADNSFNTEAQRRYFNRIF